MEHLKADLLAALMSHEDSLLQVTMLRASVSLLAWAWPGQVPPKPLHAMLDKINASFGTGQHSQ